MHDVATHDDSKGQYFWVWGALLVLTGLRYGWGTGKFLSRYECWKCCWYFR